MTASALLPLPVELVREVMDLAAETDPSVTAPALALVSKIVNHWVTPILYRTVVLDTRERIHSFNRSVEDAQCTATDKAKHVSNLAIYGMAMAHYAWSLTVCHHVQRLLLKPLEYIDELAEDSVSLWPRPWHVVILRRFSPGWYTDRLELFSRTTHLYVDEGLYPAFIDICLLMHLTHVCIGCWEDQENPGVVRESVELLLTMPSMKIVLIHAFVVGQPIEDFFDGVWLELAAIPDERLLVAPGLHDDDLLELFESGGTVWDEADALKDWRQGVQGLP